MTQKKTILILISHFTPGVKVGGPLTSAKSTINYLSDDFDFKVITFDRDFGDDTPYPNIITEQWIKVSQTDVYYIKNDREAFKSLYRILRETKFDYIYSLSLFDPVFSVFVSLLKKVSLIKGKLVIAPKGELYDEALNFKPFKKQIFLKIANTIGLYRKASWHATDEKEKRAIEKQISTKPENIKIANLLSPAFEKKNISPNPLSYDVLRMVFLARISKDKNLPFIFEVLAELDIPLQLDIYGPLEDVDIWENCQKQIRNLPLSIQVNYRGILKSALVSETLATYDLFFLPTFAENFGHSIAESMSVGTPVLISDNTPWRELEAKKWGWDFSLFQKENFVKAIKTVAELSTLERWQWRKELMNSFDKSFSLNEIIAQNKALWQW